MILCGQFERYNYCLKYNLKNLNILCHMGNKWFHNMLLVTEKVATVYNSDLIEFEISHIKEGEENPRET